MFCSSLSLLESKKTHHVSQHDNFEGGGFPNPERERQKNDRILSEETNEIVYPLQWEQVVGKGSLAMNPISDGAFRCFLAVSPNSIVRRVCPSCTSSDHRDIFYRRITEAPSSDIDFLNLFMNFWSEDHGELGQDFELYSNYCDALSQTNGWTFCNYDSSGIVGFPRDCGPEGLVGRQWNSYLQTSPEAEDHGFFVELPQVRFFHYFSEAHTHH